MDYKLTEYDKDFLVKICMIRPRHYPKEKSMCRISDNILNKFGLKFFDYDLNGNKIII